MTLASEQMHVTDLDELFAHKHEEHSGDEHEDGEPTDQRDDDDKAAAGFVLPSQRELLQGEKYLRQNPNNWNELFAPPGGCQKQKNPLQLVFTSMSIDDDVPEEGDSRPATAQPPKGKKK